MMQTCYTTTFKATCFRFLVQAMRSLFLVLVFVFSTCLLNSVQAQMIIAHRGASYDAPENTLAAFQLAWDQGADGIEGDFHLTRDGKIVCTHDKDMRRTAGSALIVAESNFDDLRKLDVGSWKHSRFSGERIPTLAEVFETVPPKKKIFIEIKCGPEIVPHLKREIDIATLESDQLVVIAFDADVIAAVRQHLPAIKANWLTSYKRDRWTGVWAPTPDRVMSTLKRIDAMGLNSKAHACVDATFVDTLREENFEFHCWTVNEPAVAKRFLDLGVDSITTDRPAWLRERIEP